MLNIKGASFFFLTHNSVSYKLHGKSEDFLPITMFYDSLRDILSLNDAVNKQTCVVKGDV